MRFGPDYIIPKPFDPRLITVVAPLVAQAAMDTGVATRPIADMAAYRERLQSFVFRSGLLMKPVFDQAERDRSGSSSPRARSSGCFTPRSRRWASGSRSRSWSATPSGSPGGWASSG